jgi:hypothetical protein
LCERDESGITMPFRFLDVSAGIVADGAVFDKAP